MPGLCFCLQRGQFGETLRDKYGELPPKDKRRLVWRCHQHRGVGPIDLKEIQPYQARALGKILPELGQFVMERRLGDLTIMTMTQVQMNQFLQKAVMLYERELRVAIDANQKTINEPGELDDEIPF